MALKAVRYDRQVDPWASDTIAYLHVQSTYYAGSFENLTAPDAPNYPDPLAGSPARYFMDTPWIINVDDLAGTRPCALYDVTDGVSMTRVTGSPSANEYRLPPDTSITRHRIELNAAQDSHEIGVDLYADGSALAGVDWNTPIFAEGVEYRNTAGSESTTATRTKIVEIGDWNMRASTGVDFIAVTHGVSDFKKIRSFYAIIRNDGDTTYAPLQEYGDDSASGVIAGGVNAYSGTTVNLLRLTGGVFDSPSYQNTSYNRGWLYITYEV